jgi:hypothetical protein
MSYEMNWKALESSVLPEFETIPVALNRMLDDVQAAVAQFAQTNVGAVREAYLPIQQRYDANQEAMTANMRAGIVALRQIIAETKRADAAGAAQF